MEVIIDGAADSSRTFIFAHGAGGAMDICEGVRTLIVAMTHVTDEGAPKLVRQCTLPITSTRAADWIVTELAMFRCIGGVLALVELAPGVSVADVRARTAAEFEVRLSTQEPKGD